jgi:hypothetical protein
VRPVYGADDEWSTVEGPGQPPAPLDNERPPICTVQSDRSKRDAQCQGRLVSWQGFLSEIASSVAANKTARAKLSEFTQAQEDHFRRIEAINQDMQYRLIPSGPEAGGLLDAPWRTALMSIRQAADSPHRFNAAMAEAHEKLLEAYAESRDSLGRSWIAQELAAAYALAGDLRNAKRWLETAYRSGLKGVNDQLWKAAAIIEQETEKHTQAHQSYQKQRSQAKAISDLPRLPHGLCRILFRDEGVSPGPGPFKETGWNGAFADATMVHRVMQGLGRLFDDLAQLRRACLQAGIDHRDLPRPYDPFQGGVRVASFVPGEDFDSLAYFDTSLPYGGPQFSTDIPIDAGIELGTFRFIYIEYS